MDVESHFSYLLKNYELNYLYIKFIGLSVLTTTLKEGFYWSLIFLSECNFKNNKNKLKIDINVKILILLEFIKSV